VFVCHFTLEEGSQIPCFLQIEVLGYMFCFICDALRFVGLLEEEVTVPCLGPQPQDAKEDLPLRKFEGTCNTNNG
jgi:hypothetical protein